MGRHAPADPSGNPRKRHVARGRRILLLVIVVLLVDEFLGILVSTMVHGGYSFLQLVAMVAVAAGAIYAFHHGDRRAYWSLVLVPGALGIFSGIRLLKASHALSAHSVLLATQTCARLVGAAVLVGSRTARLFCAEV